MDVALITSATEFSKLKQSTRCTRSTFSTSAIYKFFVSISRNIDQRLLKVIFETVKLISQERQYQQMI